MGLLMWGYKPENEKKGPKSAIKNDPTAASRSAIRRQTTVRHRDSPATERRSGRTSPRTVRLSLSNYVVEDRDGDIVIQPRSRSHQPEAPAEHQNTIPTAASTVRESETYAAFRARRMAERQAERDAERAGAARVAGESSLRHEIRNDDSSSALDLTLLEYSRRRQERLQRNGSMLMDDSNDESGEDWIVRERRYWQAQGSRSAERLSPALQSGSERFAPAYQTESRSPPLRATWESTTRRRSRSPQAGAPPVPGALDQSNAAAVSPDMPPLERQSVRGDGRITTNGISRHAVDLADGLGDRRRSLSPEGDAWETLLTTITPDERLPSVGSSFTSTTASASFSSVGDARASTSLTSPSTTNPQLDCPDGGMQTPDSLPDLFTARSATSSVLPEHVQGERLSDRPASTSFEDARRELEDELHEYSRSRMRRLVTDFIGTGEHIPNELLQAFVPRDLFVGAAGSGTADSDGL